MGLPHQLRRELDRVHVPVRLRDPGPHEHGPLGRLHLPADAVEAVAQGVPAPLVHRAGLQRVVGLLLQGDRRRYLDRLERPVVEVALELGQRGHHLGVAQHERHPPSRHRERLGARVELHRALLGPLHLQDRRRLVPVEAQVGVGVVVHDQHLAVPGPVDHLLHEVEVDAGGGGVVGDRDHRHPGLGPAVVPGELHPVDELVAVGEGHLPDLGAGEQRPVDVDRVAGGGHQAGVAGLQQHPHEVAEPLLGPDGVDDLGVGVEVHPEAALVQGGDVAPQRRQAPAGRVPVIAGVAGRLAQLVYRDLRRRQVGVAEPEVDDVGALVAELDLQVVDDREDVGREAVDPAEVHRPKVTGRPIRASDICHAPGAGEQLTFVTPQALG